MKKVKLEIRLNADNCFETGKCDICPISTKEYEELRYGEGAYIYSCTIKCSPINCPIEVEDKKEC